MEYKDYYAVLGVEKKASQDDIKHAYRRLARKYHPDVSKEKNAEEKFKNVQEAYEVLKDPEKRGAYDQLGNNWKSGQEFRPPPNWQGSHNAYSAYDAGEGDFGGFSDFFTNLFGHAHAQSAGRGDFSGFAQRGTDQHAKIKISLEDAFKGSTRTLQLQMPETGVRHAQSGLRTLKVTIPPGAMPGQQLRLTGQGAPGTGRAAAGDLYLELEIEPHPLFTLEGQDIYLSLPVTPWEAALGAEINIPTLAGKVGLKLAPGSQSGQKLRLKGRGMPGKPHTGDQYAVLQVKVPLAKTDEQKQLYEKMAQLLPFDPREGWPA